MFALQDKRASFLASQPKATHVKMENCDQRVIIFFALCPLSYAIIRGVIRAKRKEWETTKGTDRMNRKTTTLCVMAVLAMATLALPTPSYPGNAFSGFAVAFVCPKSRFSAAKVSYDLSSFDKMVVNSMTCTKHAKSLSRVATSAKAPASAKATADEMADEERVEQVD